MSATNRSNVRRRDDYYVTPSWATEALLDHVPLCAPILEPACGDGAILRVLAARGYKPLMGVEIDRERANIADTADLGLILWGDYLDMGAEDLGYGKDATAELWYGLAPTTVITNPPYSLAEEFVRHSLEIVQPGGRVIMLLRLSFLESLRRVSLFAQGSGFRGVHVLSKRPSFTGGGSDAAAYAWIEWERGYLGAAYVDHLPQQRGG